MIFICNLKLIPFKQDIESLWRNNTGDIFGVYIYSGIRAITNRLYGELLNNYKID